MGSNGTVNPGTIIPDSVRENKGDNDVGPSGLYDSDPRVLYASLRRQNLGRRQPVILDGMEIPPATPAYALALQTGGRDNPPSSVRPGNGPGTDAASKPGQPEVIVHGNKADVPPPPPLPAPWPVETNRPAAPRPNPDVVRETVPPNPTEAADPSKPRRFSWSPGDNSRPAWDEPPAHAARTNGRHPFRQPMQSRDHAPPVAPREVRTPGGNHQAEHLTDQNFNAKVLGAKGPVLVDFTQSGCPPCATISPAIDRLAQQYAGRASVYKVDVNKYPDLAAQYRVSGTPTMVVFNHGKPVDSVSGAVNPSVLAGMLDRQMPRTASNPERVPPVAPNAPERVRPSHSNAPGHPERVRPPVPTDTDDSNQPHHGERFEKFKRFIDKLKPFSRHEKEAAMTLTPYEEQSLALLNQARQRAGMQPLEFDPRLKLAALKKAEYANGRLSARDNLHYSGPPGFNSPQAAFAQVGFNDYRECADTLSGGTYERHFPPKGLINDWMGSPAHKRILMMADADVAGIAVVGDKAYICISNRSRAKERI